MSTIYITIFFFLLLAIVFNSKGGERNQQVYLIICFFIMILLHSCFNPEYSDNYWYKQGYKEFDAMSFSDVVKDNSYSLKAETGYRVLCKLLTYISSQWIFALFVISIIMMAGYYFAVKRYSSMYWLSVVLIMVGPFCQSLFVLRQHMAMGIILLTYPFILEKKLFKFLIVCFIAMSIHQTAAVFLPIYFIYNIRSNKKILFILLTSFLVLYLKFSYFLSTIASFAMNTASYGDFYLVYDEETGTNNKMALLLTSIMLLRFYLLRKEFFKEGINKLLSCILILGTILSFVGIGFEGTARLNMYYSSISFLIIPNTLSYIKDKGIQTIAGLGYFLFLFCLMFKNGQGDAMSDFWFFTK